MPHARANMELVAPSRLLLSRAQLIALDTPDALSMSSINRILFA